MPYTFLHQAKKFVAAGAGDCDPDKLTEVVNDIRQEWYSWYEKLPLFRTAEECFQLQDFAVDCEKGCETFRGVTLPRDYSGIEAIWHDGRRVELYDRWRQWQYGMSSPTSGTLSSYDAGEFPTERDITRGAPVALAFYCMDKRDEGKRIELRGKDVFGRDFHLAFALTPEPLESGIQIASLSRIGGVTKDLTQGRVVLQESGGKILSIYAPEESVPSYKRLKITGTPDGCEFVNVRAARTFTRLFDDFDVVETDNSQAWAAMARAQRLAAKPVKNPDEIRSIAADKLLAETMLRGEVVRQNGHNSRTEIRVPMPLFGMRRLRR